MKWAVYTERKAMSVWQVSNSDKKKVLNMSSTTTLKKNANLILDSQRGKQLAKVGR